MLRPWEKMPNETQLDQSRKPPHTPNNKLKWARKFVTTRPNTPATRNKLQNGCLKFVTSGARGHPTVLLSFDNFLLAATPAHSTILHPNPFSSIYTESHISFFLIWQQRDMMQVSCQRYLHFLHKLFIIRLLRTSNYDGHPTVIAFFAIRK